MLKPGDWLISLLYALLVCVMTTAIAKLVGRTMKLLVERRRLVDSSVATVLSFARYVLVAGVYLAGISVLVSGIPSLEKAITKLLAAGGVLAVVGGLAAQEALGSVVSGMMILFFKPFQIGNVVRYLDLDIVGIIEEITLHHTTIRTYENKRVIIPNSKMNSAVIENADYADSRVCSFLQISITGQSDLLHAKALIAQTVANHPNYLDIRTDEQRAQGKQAVEVVVLALTDGAVTLRASLWARTNSAAFDMKCEVQEQLKLLFDREGIVLACPRVRLEQG